MQRKRDLSSVVVEKLRERILRWEYPPGHRLTEDELSKEFGVSRSPVREALHILVANGLIKEMPRRGYKVNQLDLKGIDELYDLRLALEQFVVERLCQQGLPKSVLDSLRETWKSVRQNLGIPNEDLADMDREFHETLAAGTGNQTLLSKLREINDRIWIFRDLDFAIEGRAKGTCDQHLAILDQIEAGDADAARRAMKINVEDGRENVETVLKDALAKSYGLRVGRTA